jgi:hypothetical protein
MPGMLDNNEVGWSNVSPIDLINSKKEYQKIMENLQKVTTKL